MNSDINQRGQSGKSDVLSSFYAAGRQLWWAVLLRGVFAIILGLLALFSPSSTLFALVLLFGFFAFVDGVTAIFMAVQSRKEQRYWGWALVEGLLSIAAGLIALLWPGITSVALVFVIGFWAVLLGISQIAQSFSLKRGESSVWGWVLASGIVGVIWGLVVFFSPGVGLLSLLWLFGLIALAYGIVTVVLSLRVRATAQQLKSEVASGL
ncbi:HdeD family acid-resistance protein [Acaricomes phytoseiuli]|uniref:HdeD family acid-resistance protein n=1 Tax=Acaricomes phytoseiuli TaxID=291968 RepID=UPI0003628B35|nr:HdeD family acid-resistance protein [Acaricomes phytoseiuli]MCW1249760.1 HdeD family acid-resistance protein [Acaricomes phytoseiuli]